MKLILIVCIVFLCINFCLADFCQYNFSLSDLDTPLFDEVLSFLTSSIVCIDTTVDNSRINFWLYTREDSSGSQVDTNSPEMSLKKTVVLIPGWLCNISNDLMPELKDAYLTRYDCNVIIVDWSYYAQGRYGDAFCKGNDTAVAISNFLMRLNDQLNITIESIHVLGHSMGGQLAGLVGGYLKFTYNKSLFRITGLDPAGPLYVGLSEDQRLDKSDAPFVDVIHTNPGVLGYGPPCGHADFYPSCIGVQSGCPVNLEFCGILRTIPCDHLRSVDYMVESVNRNCFKSNIKTLIPCVGSSTHQAFMGEDTARDTTNYEYTLSTNSQSFFGKTCS